MAKKKKASKRKDRKQKKASNPMSFQKLLIPGLLFLFAFLLYSNTLNHGFVLDDDLVCLKNNFVQDGLSGLGDIFSNSWYTGFTGSSDRYYRPMMLASLALDKSLFGSAASGFHFMNVLYYALNGLLLYLLLRFLFKSKSIWFALTVSLLFIAHPIHTEVVANIKSRDELLAFLGLIGMLYGLVKYGRSSAIGYYGLGLLSYLFAILSKEAALSFLGLVPLALFFFTELKIKRILLMMVPYGIVVLFYFLIRAQIVDPSPQPFGIIDNSLFAINTVSTRISTAISMLGTYLQLLIFPHPLSYDYSYNQIPAVGWGNWRVLLSLGIYLGLIYIAIKNLGKKHPISFGLFLFGITFAITSNLFFLIGATFAERFLFTPSLGYCIIIGYLMVHYLMPDTAKKPLKLFALLGILLVLFSVKTLVRNQDWKSDNTLFSSGIKTAPNSSRAQSFYGTTRYDLALQSSNQAEKDRLLKEAISYFEKSLNVYPGFTETYQHLGRAYEANNEMNKAVESYLEATKIDPNYYNAFNNIAVIYYNQKNYNKALEYFQNAASIAPNNLVVQRGLGLTYEKLNQFDRAIDLFKQNLEEQKTEQHLADLVRVYRTTGDIETAIFYDKQIKAMRGEN